MDAFEPGDAVLVVDVFNDFDHDDGHQLLASFRERAPATARVVAMARAAGAPVVYVNDQGDEWRNDAPGVIDRALSGRGGDALRPLLPLAGDPVLLKPRYSAFDHTALDILLESMRIHRIFLVGASTEGCVVQTAIDARELGLKASIVTNACATTDAELEETALRYARLVGGARLEQV